MMAITTSNSMRVKPRDFREAEKVSTCLSLCMGLIVKLRKLDRLISKTCSFDKQDVLSISFVGP